MYVSSLIRLKIQITLLGVVEVFNLCLFITTFKTFKRAISNKFKTNKVFFKAFK